MRMVTGFEIVNQTLSVLLIGGYLSGALGSHWRGTLFGAGIATLYGVLYGEGALFYGLVVDFIQVDIPDVNWFGQVYTHWPVFNVADSCVSCGMVLLFILNKKIPMLNQLEPVNVPPEQDSPHQAETMPTASGETEQSPTGQSS